MALSLLLNAVKRIALRKAPPSLTMTSKKSMNSNFYFIFITFVSIVLLFTWYDLIVGINSAGGLNTIYVMSGPSDDDAMDSDVLNEFQWCPPAYNADAVKADLDCSAVFAGNKTAIEIAKNWTSPCSFNDETMMNMTEKCSDLKRDFRFYHRGRSPMDAVRPNEVEYPLAFVVMAAKNAEQVVRLFQAIYRPWNLYCLTYDNDTSYEFKRTLHNLDKCYNNIIMPDEFVNVQWAGFSILKTAMNCLTVLHDNKMVHNWRYVQIMSWNDFPLKTNLEMVDIMQIFNGSQDAELSEGQPERFRQFHKENSLDETKKSLKKPLPPGNLLIYKGSMAATLSREFVRFIFKNPIAKEFYNWSESVWAPEEQFWSTLVHNLHLNAPGGFPGSCLPYYRFDKSEKRYVSRYQIWWSNDCNGQMTSGSCVFGVGDLPKLSTARELVGHKMYLDFEPATYYCLSKLNFDRTFRLSNDGNYSLDREFYYNLPAVRYQKAVDKNNFQC